MKKAIALFLAFALLASTAFAWQLENTNMHYGTAPHVEGVNNNVEDMAKMLFDLGLFKGRSEGEFALQSPMTREEAAVMLVRFLGGEQEALTGKFTHPFTDVAQWADPYVGWLYQKKLTKGIGGGKYGTGNVTMWQYSTFLSRAVYGNEDNGMATKEEIAESEANGAFLREAAVALSVRALTSYYWRDTTYGNLTTAGWLCRQGVFSAEQFDAAARRVLPSALYEEKGIVRRRIALVDVATCPEQGILPAGNYEKVPGEKAFVYGAEQNSVTFYELDFVTLAVRAKAQQPKKENFLRLEYLASAEETDYFVEHLDGGSMGTKCGDLLAWNGQTLSVVKTEVELWKGKHVYPFEYGLMTERNLISGGSVGKTSVVLGIEDALLLVSENVQEVAVPAGSKVLGWDGKAVVLQCVAKENNTIFAVNVESGETVDSYIVPHDGEGEGFYRTLEGQYARQYGYYNGEAGLYKLENGRLKQLTDMPAPVVTARRVGAGSNLVILSHDLGKRCYGQMTGHTGDKIYTQNQDGTFSLYFEVKPEWELHLDTISCLDSTIHLHSAKSVGMQHFDSYTYAILPDGESVKLHVLDYNAGRPEMMEQPKEEYIRQETQRLKTLGVGF